MCLRRGRKFLFKPGQPAFSLQPLKDLQLLHASRDPIGISDEGNGRVGAFLFPVIFQNVLDHGQVVLPAQPVRVPQI